jgi:hypothetical protein
MLRLIPREAWSHFAEGVKSASIQLSLMSSFRIVQHDGRSVTCASEKLARNLSRTWADQQLQAEIVQPAKMQISSYF